MDILGTLQTLFNGSFDIANIIIYNAIIVLGIFLFYNVLTFLLKRIVFSAAKTKKERSNAIIFFHLWRYAFIFIAVIILIFAYSGSLEGLGLSAALLTAALGWALQKPISGIAGWLMVVISKPFRIGDRIIIGNVRGDVVDLSLTHVYVGEIGGTIGGEERSGRIIMVPNSKLFENDIVNYTFSDEFLIDEVRNTVTYDSNIEKAKKIWISAAKKVTKDYSINAEEPIIRTYFNPSGMVINVKYKTRADEREKIKSDITDIIYKEVSKTKDVRFAFPHTQIVFERKKRGKKV